ncbi:Uma2 family endonuclease [Leptolyngbya sp. NK1-12]|uniref:Uma2 family endonuclease n=1 Tax=Leptolyngbya sp. NK1-12 TaxID=2547451 RepID=A0AA97AF90_9CYAN|nr:Uma2 family endonuclease [Leptolyngbya sp. NK1-12]WNZ22905.1 Uma2 family endonuclease [Leptolyngbya sp. NK1-12]
MRNLQTRPFTDTWTVASWDEYIRLIADPIYEQAKGYYYKGHMRIEMLLVSFEHGKDHVIIIFVVNLFTTLKGIPATGLDTTTLRQTGVQDCQPDVSYYLRERAQAIPSSTGIVDLDRYPAPNLVIEVAKSSLLDDVGTKRALYEELGVDEYWVLDVQNAQVLAYAIADQGSRRIRESQVLPGLTIAVIEEALRRSRATDQSQVGAWLLTQFQSEG